MDTKGIADIQWTESFDAAMEMARQMRRMVVAKPAGQGLLFKGDLEVW